MEAAEEIKYSNLKELLVQHGINKIRFVKDSSGITEELKNAFEAFSSTFDSEASSIEIISQEECLNISKALLKEEKHLLVFEEFSGAAFEYVQSCGARLLGIKALMMLIAQDLRIPIGQFSIHNFSFYGLIVCTSSMLAEKKSEARKLVNLMAGKYVDLFNEQVSHLVTEAVTSEKYEEAAANNMKVMHPDWIKRVWALSQKKDFSATATDPQFEVYKLPIFFNLCITSSGLKAGDKNNIKAQVECHGGNYSGDYKNSTVDILILDKNSVGNNKHVLAAKSNKWVLHPEWIYESVKQNYAVNLSQYSHKLPKSSTPKRDAIDLTLVNPDNTQLSVIASSNVMQNTLYETLSTTILRQSMPQAQVQPFFKETMNKLTIEAGKKAGNIFDGLTFSLSGFSGDELNHLAKILSSCGAVKVDKIDESVTHILVRLLDESLLKDLAKNHINPYILRLDWLTACLEQKKHVDEANFIVHRLALLNVCTEAPSPSSKKALQSLTKTFKYPAPKKLCYDSMSKNCENNEVGEVDMTIVSQYLDGEANIQPPAMECKSQFLKGKTIFLQQFASSNDLEMVSQRCKRFGAKIVDQSYRKEIDYAISAPGILPSFELNRRSLNEVTTYWLDDCESEQKCLPLKYHHKPILELSEFNQPLKDEIIVVSGYKKLERKFISNIVLTLGGVFTEVLKRDEQPILVCPYSKGQKYLKCIDWSLSVVQASWLIECYKSLLRVDESDFLVGNAVVSSRNNKGPHSYVPSSQDINHNPRFEERKSKNPIISRSKSLSLSPRTPDQNHNITRLVADFSSPRRHLTKDALKEQKAKNGETNQLGGKIDVFAASSPMPKLPEMMTAPKGNFGIRPNSSPGAQWFHKRKLESLDENFIPTNHSKQADMMTLDTPETPYKVRRYLFFKSRIDGYSSPDPRILNSTPSTHDKQQLPVENAHEIQTDERKNDSFEASASVESNETSQMNKSEITENKQVNDDSMKIPDFHE